MNPDKHVDALKQQNETAFEAIYHETKHAVYAMVLPIVRDRSLAEDAMQETYIKMLKKIHTYKKRHKFINWLLTIAKNTALDMQRSRKHTVSTDSNANPDLFIASQSGPEKKLISEYYLSLIPPDQQQIVLLRTVGNMKHKDIATLLEMPTGTVTYLYQKALKTMREGSEEDEDNEKGP